MNIWITGCNGFLGTRLATHFTGKQNHVTGLSRQTCAAASQAVSIDLTKRESPRIIERLAAETGAPDVVVHTASKQHETGELLDFVNANVQSTSNLIEGLTQQPPRLIIYTSTLGVYGRPAVIPVDESSPAGGNLPYGATKRWAEQLLETFQRYSKIVVLRLPALYGTGQEDSFIAKLARLAQRDEPIELLARGELIRDALHVNDVVQAIDNCIAHLPSESFLTLNLGCGQRIKTIEYARALVDALASNSVIVPVDQAAPEFDLYADITAARQQIAFTPTSLLDSIKIYANELQT